MGSSSCKPADALVLTIVAICRTDFHNYFTDMLVFTQQISVENIHTSFHNTTNMSLLCIITTGSAIIEGRREASLYVYKSIILSTAAQLFVKYRDYLPRAVQKVLSSS